MGASVRLASLFVGLFFSPSREMLPPRMGLLFFLGAIFLSPFIVFFLKIYFSMLETCKSIGTPKRLLTI